MRRPGIHGANTTVRLEGSNIWPWVRDFGRPRIPARGVAVVKIEFW